MTRSFVLSRIAHPGGLTAPYQQHNQALQPHPKMSSIIPHVTPTKDNAASPSRELRFSPHTHPSVFDLFFSSPDTGPSRIPTLSHIFHTIDGFVQDTGMPYKKCAAVYTALEHTLHRQDDAETKQTILEFTAQHRI